MTLKSRFIEMFGNLETNDKQWIMSTIGESAKVPLHYGSTASAVDYDGSTRYVRITDIESDGKLNADFKSPNDYESSYLLNKGDILFARSGSVGLTYLFNEDYRSIFAGYLIRFIPNKEKLDPEFAYYFTKSSFCQRILIGSKRGGVQKNVNAKQLSSIPIPLPPMNLQKEFIEYVRQIDKSKAICKQIFESFDNLVKSRFIEMFGTLNTPKTRFEKLGDIATYVNGYAFKPSDWGAEGLPIIRIQNLSGSGSSFNYYSGDYPQTIEINKGDIMISWSATLGVFVWNGPKALLNQHIFKVYFDKIDVNPTYFRVAVEPALKRSTSQVHGSTMTHLTKKTFDSIQIPAPPIKLQDEFASFVEQVDKSKFMVQVTRQIIVFVLTWVWFNNINVYVVIQ